MAKQGFLAVLQHIRQARQNGRKCIARLIDPDDIRNTDALFDTVSQAEKAGADFLFFGGSLITTVPGFDLMKALKQITNIPVVLFPSSPMQINPHADAMLFLSLISGRNPEYLIGHHITAAPMLRASKMEILPVGYMLVACGTTTTAEYVSNTFPIPYNKPEIAATTALAGEMLGLQCIYMDGGSGAEKPVSTAMVAAVRSAVDIPIIVGGGIRSASEAKMLQNAGADVLVIGNGAEKNPHLLKELRALNEE